MVPVIRLAALNTAEMEVTVSVCTGTANASANAALKIYPNPVHYSFNLTFTSPIAEQVEMTMINSAGMVVKTEQLNVKIGENNFMFDAFELPKGIYFLQIKSQGRIINQKVVVN
ncbi:MAG: T9SS type A sorting domain-containing protein [Cytophagaceae bacterium]